jgi:uncharacterized membrane protein YhaH (DUF805 family)
MKWYLIVLKKYTDFNGRARRKEYWYFGLFNFIVAITLAFAGIYSGFVYLNTIYSLAVLLPGIAVAVRRMHDVGKSGWYALIPIYNLVLACQDGTPGENRYGSDPKRPEYDEFLQSVSGN